MKKLFRGDVLSWLEGSSAVANDLGPEDRAAEARRAFEAGSLQFAEPVVAEAIERLSAADGNDFSSRAHTVAEVRRRLTESPPEPSRWPLRARARYRIVLPQRYRVRVEQALLGPGELELTLLLRDFRPKRGATGTPSTSSQFETLHRVFHFESPAEPLREVLAFTQKETEAAAPAVEATEEPTELDVPEPVPEKTVLLAPDRRTFRVVIDDRVYALESSWAFEEVARLKTFEIESGLNRLRAVTAIEDGYLVVFESWEDDCRVLRFDGSGGRAVDLGFAGSSVGCLYVEPPLDTPPLDARRIRRAWVSDLHVVRGLAFEARGLDDGGESQSIVRWAERDLSPFFAEYRYTGREIVVGTPHGGLLVSNGRKVLSVSRDLAEVHDEMCPPQPVMAVRATEDAMVCLSVDAETATAVLTIYDWPKR